MRLAAYAGTSALVAAGALLKAFHQRPNFYSATVYLSQSNACILILTNLALVAACSFIYGLQRLFYGPLRPIEIEHLSEKAWYAVLDTLLAMPSLRDEVGGWMLAVFVLLLATKVWSWIGEGRIDILEQQPPQNPRLFHARLASSLLISTAFSAAMLRYCIATVKDDPRPGMMVIFTFEFAILLVFSLFSLGRYGLALVEARILQLQTKTKMEQRRAEIRTERERLEREREDLSDPDSLPPLPSEEDVDENEIDVPGWEDKRRWLFGLELATDFVKLIIYTVFFGISLTFMGLPMHIIRDVYLTFASFAKRLQDYNNYRKATQNMNSRYPDATSEELTNDNTCIVCREIMVPWAQPDGPPTTEAMRAKKLPCGHILHLRCLKAWLERQQACPTCRRPVIAPNTTPTGAANPHAGAAGAGGAQQAANAPAVPANRPRLRMLNLGPIRIGLYNGPANQVQEALNDQRRGQPAAATQTPTATPGLGVLAGGASADTQFQLVQVEERLMQESRRLQIEHSQLATVRVLEAELARLRAHYSLNQAGQGLPTMLNSFPPYPPPLPPMTGPGSAFMPPQAFQPGVGQEPMTHGHEGLPTGLVLPEGWTLTPLNRVEGTAQVGGQVRQTQFTVPVPTVETPTPAISMQQEGSEQPETFGAQETTLPNEPPAEQSNIVPDGSSLVNHSSLDENGPLSSSFSSPHGPSSSNQTEQQEPTTTNESVESPTTIDNAAASGQSNGSVTASRQPNLSPPTTGLNAWGADSSWSFDDVEAESSSNIVSPSNEAEEEQQQARPLDKGKGRAVSVEDVEDTGE